MELRWIERAIDFGNGIGRIEKVLQYCAKSDIFLSKWQDVPTVTEQEGE